MIVSRCHETAESERMTSESCYQLLSNHICELCGKSFKSYRVITLLE